MKNKQKAWRRPEVQAQYRKEAVAAAKALAAKAEGKSKRFFLDRAYNLDIIRIGRLVKEHFTSIRA